MKVRKGASIYDVRKIFGFLDPLPLSYTQFTQPCSFCHPPFSPPIADADIICGSPQSSPTVTFLSSMSSVPVHFYDSAVKGNNTRVVGGICLKLVPRTSSIISMRIANPIPPGRRRTLTQPLINSLTENGVWGLPYMMSALEGGGGHQKADRRNKIN